ncbi:hypothetical protein FMIA91_16860 [Fidelibacter multiformis]|jgi:hypothetical protein
MLSTISKQIIEAGGILSLPLGERNQILSGIVYPLPETPDRKLWFTFYKGLCISELALPFLIENDIRLLLGKSPANFKFLYIDDRLKIKTRNNLIGPEEHTGNLSAEYLKWISGIPLLKNISKGIYLNCHHVDGNQHNDTPSNLGLIRASCHGQVHNTHCILSLENAPYIPLVHIMNNVFGIDWFITENGIERTETYTFLDVEKDVLTLLDKIEKGNYSPKQKRLLASA